MFRLSLTTIAPAVAACGAIYGLLWLACYLTDHDQLVMLHMYYSPIILSLALGIILSLDLGNARTLHGRSRGKASFNGGLDRHSR